MSVMMRNKLQEMFTKTNENGEEESNNGLRYLVLMFSKDETDDDRFQEFEITYGRENTIDAIFDFEFEFGSIDWFKSTVISEKVTPNNGISFYSFLRFIIESDTICIPNIETVDDLNEIVHMDDLFDYCVEKYNIKSLDEFYKNDISHNI